MLGQFGLQGICLGLELPEATLINLWKELPGPCQRQRGELGTEGAQALEDLTVGRSQVAVDGARRVGYLGGGATLSQERSPECQTQDDGFRGMLA